MSWVRKALVVGLAMLASILPSTTGVTLTNPCDDGMGTSLGDGSDLRKVPLPDNGTLRLPGHLCWANYFVRQAVIPGRGWSNQRTLDEIMTWPRDAPPKTKCKLHWFTYTRLCIPKNGTIDDFRAKLRMVSSCGTMNVKWRLRVNTNRTRASVIMWGRTAS